MPLYRYIDKDLADKTLYVVAKAREICLEYANQGYDLTLRQLYYQFVARALIPNTDRSYKRLGNIVSDARLLGYLDWDYIVDRTRTPNKAPSWASPAELIEAAASQYQEPVWADQDTVVEVWVEKEALAGVVERTADRERVLSFSCRGYVSQSAMWRAAQRHLNRSQDTVVLHLGDHDPSGIDMTRDIQDRLDLFESGAAVYRIALTMDQIEEQDPPPNPTKLTDSRAGAYVAEFGYDSWELDALDPGYLDTLITEHISRWRDEDAFQAALQIEAANREELMAAAANWGDTHGR